LEGGVSTLITGGSLIQSSFGFDGAHNLEAVIARPRGDGLFDVQHYWRLTDRPDAPWNTGATLPVDATGPGSMCQRGSSGGVNGNFEVVVPVARGLAHVWLDNNPASASGWHRVNGLAALGATGPGAVVENRATGNLELVATHGDLLIHHRFDRTSWQQVATISGQASGAPALIQSDYDNHLEVVVPEGGDLVLYWFDGNDWRPGGLITNAGDGPVSLVQGRYGADPHRNFELVVPRGDTLALYWRENSREGCPWRLGGLATWGAGPVAAASLCSSDLGDGWLQVLTQEGTSIYHLYRHRLGNTFRWMRSACIRLDDRQEADIDPHGPRSWKIAQVTGEPDCQTKTPTLSTSRSTAGVRGTDLGVTVDHAGRRFLLFGDTHWDDQSLATLDSIAEVHPAQDAPRPSVLFHGSPLRVVGGPVTELEYDVPLDGFSIAGQLFVFFSSDHFCDGKVMGRSVLTRALQPAVPIDPQARDRRLDHQLLTTFSSYRFINVSVQLRAAHAVPGFGDDGHILLVWGSGGYRADDLRLAVIDLRDPALWSYLLDNRPFPPDILETRFFAGLCGNAPLWSAHEEDARPLMWPSALGELSVSWVPAIGRYLLLAMAGPEDPIGAAVFLRTAPSPWGPWSRRRQVFDWWLDGGGKRQGSTGHFIHEDGTDDGVGDCIFDKQCHSGGGAYAPYLHDVALDGDEMRLRYTLSTWNPYQVMLMGHVVRLSDLQTLETG
jgi:hypothetical protein